MTTARNATTALALLLGTGAALASDDPLTYETLLLSGASAPGAAGATFATFGAPTLDGAGDLVFPATLQGAVTDADDRGLWTLEDGSLTLVARKGDAAVGAPGDTFLAFDRPYRNMSGDVAFNADINGKPVDERGLWLRRDGVLQRVALSGDAMPDVGGDQIFGPLSMRLGESREVLYQSFFDFTTSTRISGAFSFSNGVTTTLAADEAPAPGGAGDINGFVRVPEVDSSGDLALWAELDDGGPNGQKQSVFTRTGGVFSLAASEGDVVPGTGGETIDHISAAPLFAQGRLVYAVRLETGGAVDDTNRLVLLRRDAGVTTVVARSGDAAPGTGGVPFAGGYGFGMNATGDIVFRTGLDQTSPGVTTSNDAGLWLADADGGTRLIAREGTDPPGPLPSALAHIEEPTINAEGDVVFASNYAGSPIAPGRGALWAWDAFSERLFPVAIRGRPFDVDPDPVTQDLRNVREVHFVNDGSGLEDGRAAGFNNDGLIAFALVFTDGSAGVFTARLGALSACAADIDCDGDVDLSDFGLFGAEFGRGLPGGGSPCIPGDSCPADLDSSGVVDLTDFGLFGAQFGRGLPGGGPPCDTPQP